jgi:hypothetical protein
VVRDGGGADVGVSGDAEADPCQTSIEVSDAVEEVGMASDAPPPYGGEIHPGTYDLAELYAHDEINDGGTVEASPEAIDAGKNPSGPSLWLTGARARTTIIVTANMIIRSEARGTDPLPEPVRSASTYTIDDTSLVLTPKCPTGGAPVRVGFYAGSQGSLALLFDGKRREVFVRR